jgi:DNA-binding NtrC family response regulator
MPQSTLPKSDAACFPDRRMPPIEKPFVLVIEDDVASAEALAMILCDWGADVAHVHCADALDAALGARAGAVHFIIADYHLGDGPDGISLAARASAAAPGSRVLVLSGSFHGRASLAARQAGFDIMHKPARADAILAWLERR